MQFEVSFICITKKTMHEKNNPKPLCSDYISEHKNMTCINIIKTSQTTASSNYFIFLFPVLNIVLRSCLFYASIYLHLQIFIHTIWIFLLKWNSAPWSFLQLVLNFQLMLKRIELRDEHDMHMSDCACIVHFCQKTSESSRASYTMKHLVSFGNCVGVRSINV